MSVSKPIAVRVPLDVENRLAHLSEISGRPISYYIRDLITRHLSEIEEEIWAQEAVSKWVKTGMKTRPAEELWAELGI